MNIWKVAEIKGLGDVGLLGFMTGVHVTAGGGALFARNVWQQYPSLL